LSSLGRAYPALDEGKVDRIMRKIVGLTLFAMLLVCGIAAASAFAESPLWLVDGVEASAGTASTITGLLTFTDLNTPLGVVSIHCEDSFDGTIGPNGVDEITEILNASGVKIGAELTGTAIICTNVSNCNELSEFWPDGLPWDTQLELSGTNVVDDFTALGTGGEVGFEVRCAVLGVAITDLCGKVLTTSTIEQMEALPASDLLRLVNEEGFLCTLNATETGHLEGEGLIEAGGLVLTVSGDGITD
jgi:hypothetical protein